MAIVVLIFASLFASPTMAYNRDYRPTRRGLLIWAVPPYNYGLPESIKSEAASKPAAEEADLLGGIFGFVGDTLEGVGEFVGDVFTG